MGELGRSLENWLDEVADIWGSDEHLPLYTKATKAIAKMWQSVSELKTPRAARAIIKSLDAALEKASQNKEQEVIDNVLYDGEQTEAVQEEVSAEVAEDLNEILEDITLDVTDVVGEEPPLEESVQAAPAIEDIAAEETAAETIADAALLADAAKGEANSELLALFTEEANEILPQVGSELRAWKSKPKAKQHADALQRSLHTLKGSARMASQTDIGDIAHGLEEYILKVRIKLLTCLKTNLKRLSKRQLQSM